jgi:hypothetical protein
MSRKEWLTNDQQAWLPKLTPEHWALLRAVDAKVRSTADIPDGTAWTRTAQQLAERGFLTMWVAREGSHRVRLSKAAHYALASTWAERAFREFNPKISARLGKFVQFVDMGAHIQRE